MDSFVLCDKLFFPETAMGITRTTQGDNDAGFDYAMAVMK